MLRGGENLLDKVEALEAEAARQQEALAAQQAAQVRGGVEGQGFKSMLLRGRIASPLFFCWLLRRCNRDGMLNHMPRALLLHSARTGCRTGAHR